MDKKKAKNVMWFVPLAGLMAAAVPLRKLLRVAEAAEIMTAMFRELNIYYVDETNPASS